MTSLASTPTATATTTLTPKRVVVDQVPGLWFPMGQAKRIAQRLKEAAQMEDLIEAQDEEIALRARQAATASASLSVMAQLNNENKKRADDFKAVAEKQSEELSAWYRNPYAVIGAGGVAAVLGVVLGVVLATRGSSPTINVQK